MKVYHYCKIDSWEDIKNGGAWIGADEPGLIPLRRVGMKHPDAFDTLAVFCLLEPLPKEWTNNPHFKEIWDHLKRNIGQLLIEIEVDKNTKAFVIDRAKMQGFLEEDKNGVPSQFLFPSREDAEREYVESKISLEEYLKRKDELNFSLPEVIITERVPLLKIRISDEQPVIEERLKELKGRGLSDSMYIERLLEKVPELKDWYEKNEPSLEMKKEFSPKII